MNIEFINSTEDTVNKDKNQEQNYNNIVFSKQLFDLPCIKHFNLKTNNYLVKHDKRTLFLFQIDDKLRRNLLRRFILYDQVTNLNIYEIDDQIYFFILFKDNFLSVLNFEEENYFLKRVAFLNFNRNSASLINSNFENDIKFKFSKNLEIFYLLHNNNKIDLFILKKKKEVNWLFNLKSKMLDQNNNFFEIKKNVYQTAELFYESTISINFKKIMGKTKKNHILNIQRPVRKNAELYVTIYGWDLLIDQRE